MVIKGLHKDPKEKDKKKKVKTIGKLKKELWVVFTAWVKKNERNICFTCGRYCEGSGCHGGHFITKSIGGVLLYFDEDNCHVQCYNCNINLSGNIWEYGKRLGPETVSRLLLLKETSRATTWGRKEYEERIELYKERLAALA